MAPLYRGPYLVLERKDKFFRLQLGSRTDVVSVDRLKSAFQAASPPARGQSISCPALGAPDPPPSSTTSATVPAGGSVQKPVRFRLPPPVPLGGILDGRFVIEEPAPPSLRRSFSGGLMSANLFQSFWNTTGSRRA